MKQQFGNSCWENAWNSAIKISLNLLTSSHTSPISPQFHLCKRLPSVRPSIMWKYIPLRGFSGRSPCRRQDVIITQILRLTQFFVWTMGRLPMKRAPPRKIRAVVSFPECFVHSTLQNISYTTPQHLRHTETQQFLRAKYGQNLHANPWWNLKHEPLWNAQMEASNSSNNINL